MKVIPAVIGRMLDSEVEMNYLVTIQLEKWVMVRLLPDTNGYVTFGINAFSDDQYKTIHLIDLTYDEISLVVHVSDCLDESDFKGKIDDLLMTLDTKSIRMNKKCNQRTIKSLIIKPIKKSQYRLLVKKRYKENIAFNISALDSKEKSYYNIFSNILSHINEYNLNKHISLLSTFIHDSKNDHMIHALCFLLKSNYFTKFRTLDCNALMHHSILNDLKSSSIKHMIYIFGNYDNSHIGVNQIEPLLKSDYGNNAYIIESKDLKLTDDIKFHLILKSNEKPQSVFERTQIDESLKDLNEMIGLNRVKETLKEVFVYAYIEKTYNDKHEFANHFAFLGGPGTGKTTVARLIGKCFYDLNLLQKKEIVEVDRSGLVAGYIGHTAIKTNKVLKEADGGVLFIDEAYSLYGEGKDVGKEAISTLVKYLEDNRTKFVSIFAGYEEPMNQMIAMNQGLKSRINHHLHFDQYTPDEMCLIFKQMASLESFEIKKDLLEKLYNVYLTLPLDECHGRTVRNDFESVKRKYAFRLYSNETLTDIKVLKAIDYVVPYQEQIKKIIGF